MNSSAPASSEWDDWVGRSKSMDAYLDCHQAHRMQALLDREGSLRDGDPVPPAWHWLYFHEIARASDLGPDGHTRLGVFLPPFPLPRRMWAGGRIEWLSPLRFGESAQRTTTIQSIEPKQGRTGSLIFTTIEHIVKQSGVTCIKEQQNIVYREAATESKGAEPELAETQSDFSASWRFGTTELFRYSALTFNGHKIHYDSDYTQNVEGYSSLVVHGPLLATLMLDLAAGASRSLTNFDYRAKSPVTLPHGLTTHGRVDGSATHLWVAHDNGALAMTGTLS